MNKDDIGDLIDEIRRLREELERLRAQNEYLLNTLALLDIKRAWSHRRALREADPE